MSKTTVRYLRGGDEFGVHWTDPMPPEYWGEWTDEAIDAIDPDDIPDHVLDRLDARDEAEVD